MFLLNSRSSLVTATPTKQRRYSRARPGHPFSQSYGVRLPSSLTRVISHALVSSTCLPVSVCGTVSCRLTRGFSWRHDKPLRFAFLRHSLPAGALRRRDLPPRQPLQTNTDNQPRDGSTVPRHPIADNACNWFRNIHLMSIGLRLTASP